MDAQQAVRLIAEIELRLAFAEIGQGQRDSAQWPVTAPAAAEDASVTPRREPAG